MTNNYCEVMYYRKISQVPLYLSYAASVTQLVDLKADCHGLTTQQVFHANTKDEYEWHVCAFINEYAMQWV